MQTEDDIQRRRRMMQEALQRGLQRPANPSDPFNPANANVRRAMLGQSFAPGESAGIPDFVNSVFRAGRERSGLDPTASRQNPALGQAAVSDRGLSLPQPPATPNINLSGVTLPTPSQPIAPAEPSPRIGYSTAGLTGVDRLLQRRRALEEADPESRVTDTGEILPPRKTGRLSGLGQGFKVAAAGIDPNHPMFSLGQLVGGGISGLASPRSAAKESRRLDMARLDNDVARGLKLEQEQAQLEAMRGPKLGPMSTREVAEGEYPGIEAGTEIRTRVDPRTGSITDVIGPNNRPVISRGPQARNPHYESDDQGYLITVQGGQARRVTDPNGNPVRVKSKNADGEVVEVEVNGQRLKVTPGQALNYYGQVGAQATKRDEARQERERNYNAAKSEYDSLVEAEKSAAAEKDRAYGVLNSMRTSNQPKEDIAQAEDAAKAADAYYRTFGEKKKDAARRMQENQAPAPVTTQPYAGRTMSQANLERYAKDKGLSVDEARRQVEAQGVRVQ